MPENIGAGTVSLVAPRIGTHRCGTCKFQNTFPEFGDNKLCTRLPPQVSVVAELFRGVPPGAGLQAPNGQVIDFPAGGQHVAQWKNEVRYPPAPDHWTCGEWKPKFLDTDGNRVE